MYTKLTPLLQKTAEITGYSNEQVASVIAHVFTVIKDYTINPTKAGIRLPYIGVIRSKIKKINHYLLRDGIRMVRQGKLSKERFKAFWNLRSIIREDDKRRDHKTRYGYVFNPDWRQSNDSVE